MVRREEELGEAAKRAAEPSAAAAPSKGFNFGFHFMNEIGNLSVCWFSSDFIESFLGANAQSPVFHNQSFPVASLMILPINYRLAAWSYRIWNN